MNASIMPLLSSLLLVPCLTYAQGKIDLTVEAKRLAPDQIRLVLTLTNRSGSAIWLEKSALRFGGWHGVSVRQIQPGGKGVYVGPGGDLPPDGIVQIHNGETEEILVTLYDPYHGNEKVPLRGTHQVSLRYFLTPKEWRRFLAGKVRGARTALSNFFEIRPP